MRKKAYYTSGEIINNLYTTGKEFQLPDGTEYVGLYHKYTTGEIYTDAKWSDKTSKKLVPYVELPAAKKTYINLKQIKTTYKTPVKSVVSITAEDRIRGFCYRYFIKKSNQFDIIEINESQYKDWSSKKIDPNLYTAVKITWYITGNIQDEKSGIAIKPGVISKNTAELKTAEQRLSGITAKLTNLTEYYTDADFVVPKDINE